MPILRRLPSVFTDIFRKGSKTYYYSSIFFPKQIRDDVFILYSFVRTADNYVDQIPQDEKGFTTFVHVFNQSWQGKNSGNLIIDKFVELAQRKKFELAWITAFLDAMKQDFTIKTYERLEDTEHYMYGSAEVIGLMMSRILNLPKESDTGAKLLGKAMQYINFIRDIEEDTGFGRNYFPQHELRKYHLPNVTRETAEKNKKEFADFIHKQIQYYVAWQKQAEPYIQTIPKRYRIPIQTASDMYKYTASVIQKNPSIVYEKKVKPSLFRIVGTILYHWVH